MKILWHDKWGYNKMILLLLFSISSTIRASNAQKPKPKKTLCACADFFRGAQSIRNAAENYITNFADFLVWYKYEKWCKYIRNFVYRNFRKSAKRFYNCSLGGWTKFKKKKQIYFLTLRHSSFLLPPVMECFTGKGAFWNTLIRSHCIPSSI